MMTALVIGATGYVGLRIAQDLIVHGYRTSGLARSAEKAAGLEEVGVVPLLGDVTRTGNLADLVSGFDVVVFAAMVPFETETEVIRGLVDAMCDSGAANDPDNRHENGRSLVFISGSAVVALAAQDGSWNDNTFAEDDPFPFPALPARRIRLGTEQIVRDAADRGLRTFVIRPPLIWGHGGSIQVPQFFESARSTGSVCYLGQGMNLYSHVHVDDVATVSRLALERGTPGAVYHAVAGEVNFRTIAEAVGSVVDAPTRSLDYDAACDLWGAPWVDLGLAVNSRIRAPRTRAELGWTPAHHDLVEDIRTGSYRAAYLEGGRRGEAYSWSGHG